MLLTQWTQHCNPCGGSRKAYSQNWSSAPEKSNFTHEPWSGKMNHAKRCLSDVALIYHFSEDFFFDVGVKQQAATALRQVSFTKCAYFCDEFIWHIAALHGWDVLTIGTSFIVIICFNWSVRLTFTVKCLFCCFVCSGWTTWWKYWNWTLGFDWFVDFHDHRENIPWEWRGWEFWRSKFHCKYCCDFFWFHVKQL